MSLPNFFLTTLAQTLLSGGSETEVFVSSITTLDGQDINAADFAQFGRGTLTIDPQSTARTEFISFTGVDATGIGFTGITRGLSFKDNTSLNANKKFHPVGSQVLISWGTHNILDLLAQFATINLPATINGAWTFTVSPLLPTPTLDAQAATKQYVDTVAISGAPVANATTPGVAKLSLNPVDPLNPIAIGNNDTRIPTQGENDALVGTLGTPSSSNQFVTNNDTATSGAGKVLRLDGSGKYPPNDGSLITNIPRLIFASSSTSSFGTGTVGEVTIYSFTIPGGTLGTGNVVMMNWHVASINNQFTSSVTVRVRYGGAIIASFSMGTGVTWGPGMFTIILMGNGSTGAQFGSIFGGTSDATSSAGALSGSGTTSVGSTIDQTFSVAVQYASANNFVGLTPAGFVAYRV